MFACGWFMAAALFGGRGGGPSYDAH